MPDTETPKPARGRPSTGQAKTSTQRSRERRARLAQQLGAYPVTAIVSEPGLAGLNRLREAGMTVDQAVSWALEQAGKQLLRDLATLPRA